MIEELILKTELICDKLVFNPNDTIMGIRVEEKHYKIFLSNGWWAVDSEYFYPKEACEI